MKTKTYLLIAISLYTLFSSSSFAISCPKSFEGIKALSKKKRLECTLYKVGILERYLDDEGQYDFAKEMEKIGHLSSRLNGMESKLRGITENYCYQNHRNDSAKTRACLANWEKVRR